MLEGKLVGLKPLEQADGWLLHNWFNDQRVLENLGGDMYFAVSHEEESAFVHHMVTDENAVWFIVMELKRKEPIGVIGLAAMDQRSASAELRIVIGEPKFWDKGYGGDAIDLTLREAFVARHLHRVWLRVVTYNERAIACYEKCGFTPEGTARHDHFQHGEWRDAHHMSILAEEYGGRKRARG